MAKKTSGDYVREEIDHVREGKHGARSTKQAIAIGLSKARRAGVKTATPKRASKRVKAQVKRENAAGRHPHKISKTRSRAATKALRKEGHSAASHASLSRHARKAAKQHTAKERSASARKAARTRAHE